MINRVREIIKQEIVKRHRENKELMEYGKGYECWHTYLANEGVIRVARQMLIDDLGSRPRENDYGYKKDGILNYIPSENIFRRARQS